MGYPPHPYTNSSLRCIQHWESVAGLKIPSTVMSARRNFFTGPTPPDINSQYFFLERNDK